MTHIMNSYRGQSSFSAQLHPLLPDRDVAIMGSWVDPNPRYPRVSTHTGKCVQDCAGDWDHSSPGSLLSVPGKIDHPPFQVHILPLQPERLFVAHSGFQNESDEWKEEP